MTRWRAPKQRRRFGLARGARAHRKPRVRLRSPSPMQFNELKLIAPLLRAVAGEGYSEPTPIQRECIPHVLEGRDLLG